MGCIQHPKQAKHWLHTLDCKCTKRLTHFTVLYLHKFPTVRSYLPGSEQITHSPSDLPECNWYNLAQLVHFGNDKVFVIGRGKNNLRGMKEKDPRAQETCCFLLSHTVGLLSLSTHSASEKDSHGRAHWGRGGFDASYRTGREHSS